MMSTVRGGAWVRAEAANVVEAVIAGGKSLDATLRSAEQCFEPRDRSLLRMLAYGVLRHHYRLREQIGILLDRPLEKRDKVIESLIAVGLFQLTDTRVPDHAAVSTTVEAARLLRRPKYAGLINAVLRNSTRKDIPGRKPCNDESTFDHPAWLIERLKQDWPDHWQSIIEANNERAPMWLRVNSRKTTAADYLELLKHVHADDAPGVLLEDIPQAISLSVPMAVEKLPGFMDGLVSVQDAGAQIAAPWLLANGVGRVLDACAAPGGKTCHLLELLGPGADVTALDIEPERLGRLRENLDRQGFDATVIEGDASDLNGWWDGNLFDLILLDAPCSASGVIRRHPDIKLLRRDNDIAALSTLQRSMLGALWEALAPGGRLLYVTCSVLQAENDAVVTDFLGAQNDALEDKLLHDYNIRALMHERNAGFQVLPGTQGLDGFYFAALDKTASGEK
jgi:16S rRNA (cytosine967-C5)-methyltransferase